MHGTATIARETGIKLDEAKEFIDRILKNILKLKSISIAKFKKQKKRIRHYPLGQTPIEDITAHPRLQSNAERIAINTPFRERCRSHQVAMVNIQKN